PDRAPCKAIVRYALPNVMRPSISAAIKPPEAAALVFINTTATEFALSTDAVANTEPPLKPNQPIHKMNVPKVAKGKLAPGIAIICPYAPYLPFRAPSNNTPANAAAAPAICTIPEPAKSENPSSPKLYRPKTEPPPHVQ